MSSPRSQLPHGSSASFPSSSYSSNSAAPNSAQGVSSPADTQDLASWVHQVRQRNSSISSASSAQPHTTTASQNPQTSSASDLEAEFLRQKLERQQRRDRLSTTGIRGISASSHPSSPVATPSTEFASIGLHTDSSAMMNPPATSPVLGSSPSKSSGVTGIKRANSLLARYGGQYGPTGVASGPRGPSDSPVSLANFMGGKAAGPRLGKLVGDGKSAPPEADMIHENRRVALPGLANPSAASASPGGGRALASFLGERADALGNRRSTVPVPASPVKESPSFITAPRSLITDSNTSAKSSVPAKYSFSSAELGRPTRTSVDLPPSDSTAAAFRPSSPKKAYLDLVEKQNAGTPSAPTSPAIQRASSPSKFHRFGGDSTPASPQPERSSSPFKPQAIISSDTASRPLPIPPSQTSTRSVFESPRKDAATSPLKPEDLTTAKIGPAPSQTQAESTGGPFPTDQSATAAGETPISDVSDRATSLSGNVDISSADRMPTASLTRLSAKKMVGQRIKEAQLRDVSAQREQDALQIGSGRSLPSSPAVRNRWPPGSQGGGFGSPSRPSVDDRKVGGWSPTKYGNALPGMAGRSPTKDSATASGLPSSPKKEILDNEPRPEPIRLPGMGASTSPFKRFAEAQKQEASVVPSPETPSSPAQVLEPLTKSRAKGPVRRGAHSRPEAPTSAGVSVDATPASATSPAEGSNPVAGLEQDISTSAPSKPPRRITGKRIHVLISGSGSNLQSLIDATLLDPPPGVPTISDAHIAFVLSNRKAAYGLTRAAESNPSIPTKVLALKTWQNRNPGGTREEYDRVLARAVLDGPNEDGTGPPPDLIVLAGFMHIVSEPFLHALGHQTSLPANTRTIGSRPSKPVPIINLHPALPGAFDGANAIPRAFEAYQQGAVDKTGCMVHEVVADVDRGRPIIVREVPILPSYDLEKLEEAIHKVEHIIIVQAADLVLKGYLEELDRKEAATRKTTQTTAASAGSDSPRKGVKEARDPKSIVRIRGGSASAEVVATAESLVAGSRGGLDKYLLASDVIAQTPETSATGKSVSVEVISVSADGFTEPLEFSGDQTFQKGEQLRREQILYDDEVLVVVQRCKATSGLMETHVWVRIGLHSALHPFELGPLSTSCPEGRRVSELAQRYSVKPKFVPAGCEDDRLISALAGSWAICRQGSRKRFDVGATALYRVRQALPSFGQKSDAFTIQQVPLHTASLCSGDSFVISLLSSISVWHGSGSSASKRSAALRFGQALVKASSTSVRSSDGITELNEGLEDNFFWNVFDKKQPYASAWYHSSQVEVAKSDVCVLLDVEVADQQVRIAPYSPKGYFGADDLLLPTRAKTVSILNLSDRELFVVVGQEARSDKRRIAAAIHLAEALSTSIQDKLRSLTAAEAIVARPAVHVLVLPSKIPAEICAAARVWSDEIVDFLQGPSITKMNLFSGRKALEQLRQDSWPLWMLQDPDCLPVGLGPEDVQQSLFTS